MLVVVVVVVEVVVAGELWRALVVAEVEKSAAVESWAKALVEATDMNRPKPTSQSSLCFNRRDGLPIKLYAHIALSKYTQHLLLPTGSKSL